MTLKFDVWPWETIWHLFYATSSFLHHFATIGEFKLELQSGSRQSRSNSMIFGPCDLIIWRMTFENNRAHLLLQSGKSNLGQIWRFWELCDLKIWQMTLKNNRAPLLCYFKLPRYHAQFGSNLMIFRAVWPWNLTYDLEKPYGTSSMLLQVFFASFRNHWWIQTGVTVRKHPIWVKFDDFFSPMTLKFDRWS